MRSARELVKQLPCAASGNDDSPCYGDIDPAHIKTVGAGAGESMSEMIPLCRKHHTLQHKIGFKSFCEQFPPVERQLNLRGWFFENVFGVWKLRRR